MMLLCPVLVPAAEGGAQKPGPAVPAEFLEYLAALEGEDDNWTDFEAADAVPPASNTARPAAPEAAKPAEKR